jgi:hypothetical protein
VALQLHHIDHDHANDAPSNHLMLCIDCHRRLTPAIRSDRPL